MTNATVGTLAGSKRAPCDLGVSIINYRTADMTIACARSALAAAGDRDVRIAIVDNASRDGSTEAISNWLAGDETAAARVELVASPDNTGFSGGHNIGMAALDARYYLPLNSDALVRSGAFDALIDAAETSPRVGLVAPRLEHEDSEPQVNCFRMPGPMSEIIRGANSGPVTRLLRRWDLPLGLTPAAKDIEWASFACILLRAEMVDRIGPMDEGFFLYSEDAEYCLRARRAGWRIAFEPRSRIVHFRGGSAPVKQLVKAYRRPPAYLYASRTRLHRIAHGRLGPLSANLAWTFGRALAHLRLLTGRRLNPGVEAEGRDIWINFLNPLGDSRRPEE